ncbi:ABC transporter permease [Runella salmonicolor]|uniref:ABC transporter permease n=1 Tax=Runella salmonicolor TaxID=2950278 RepID=A0ABT1FQX6_9BACT|nr:ABC transporter permease [Runella salmonicolor]MCP1384127.1 ABC transporter permease [Runella salmonicolor]
MLTNYFKIAWRNLLKNKIFSFINVAGLAIGLCCFIMIALYVTDELSYDRFHEKADRIYRVHADIRFGGTDLKLAVSSDPMGATLKKDYPQVEQFVRLYTSDGSKSIKKGKEYIVENRVGYADSTLFDVFTLPAIAGDTKTALDDPNTVVISESAARKYFGTTDAVGKTLEVGVIDKTLYKVTAVIQDIPTNSHFNFDFIFSMDNVRYDFGSYLSNNFYTYILLREGTDYKVFEKKMDEVLVRYVLPQAKQYMQINSMDEFKKAGNKLEYSLMPLTDIHLRSDRYPEIGVNGSIQYVYIFSAVALFLLLIACINFMNLSTARSSNRAKEVGIRKVMGTERQTLIAQFIAESTLTSYMAFLFALLLTIILIPYFNDISAKTFSISSLFQPQLLIFLLILPFVVGILAGYYPAFFLSSFRPIEVLKGKFNAGFKRSNLRNMLVTFQFVTSLVLVIGTIIVYQQLNYIQTKKLGFDKDQVLIINGTGALTANRDAFKNEVGQMAGVKSASYAGYLPVANSSRSDNTFSKEAVMDMKNGFNMQVWNVDYDYVPTLGMEVIKGRNFSKSYGSDSSAVLINETTAKVLGYDNPIGKKIYTSTGSTAGINTAYEIVGVVKNFHYESLRQQVGPLCMRLGNNSWTAAFKINTKDVPGLVSQIEAKWKSMAPEMPFSYQFLDESFDQMYRAEQRVGKVALTFAILTILIACLGLFGLVTYMAEQRTKEIGIRKVLGASVPNIVSLLSGEFLVLVVISVLIASPIAYYAMSQWLTEFAYRIEISWWMFLTAGILAICIALLTVSFQAIRAALMNPVNSLKSE